ncbi:MAG: hypothetical protein LBM08_04350 [Dysgonamonadaceae bacterium]|nr:hypothetical protein [Dysgonamonadaceae bacterium]
MAYNDIALSKRPPATEILRTFSSRNLWDEKILGQITKDKDQQAQGDDQSSCNSSCFRSLRTYTTCQWS